VITNDDEVAERVRRLRFHGSEDKTTFVDVGYNSRLDELQAAALRLLLPELDGWNASRRAAAAAYREQGLGDVVSLPAPVAGADPVYHLYVVRSPDADALARHLESDGVGVRAYYRVPVHLQPAMERWGGPGLDLPGTEIAARENLAFPMGSDLASEAVAEVVSACRGALV
jgi:dTDP-4-amino-4,6-dideoxygalactose transaminase